MKTYSAGAPLKLALYVFASVLAAACSPMPPSPESAAPSIAGRIFDTRTASHISRDELMRRAVMSQYVMLGESHDNAEHHRLQSEIFEGMLRRIGQVAIAGRRAEGQAARR